MMPRPSVLVIAGSDSSGLAGIQRDNQSVLALGGHPLNVITATTAQDADGVSAINAVAPQAFAGQLVAGLAQRPSVVKSGLLACPQQIDRLVTTLGRYDCPALVIDPVIFATSGERLSDEKSIGLVAEKLLPRCSLITPNLDEAGRLCGFPVDSAEGMIEAAKTLLAMGAENVLLKGGHLPSGAQCRDYFCNRQQQFWLNSPRRSATNTRGTGCALASAIACGLALGYSMVDAVVIGKMAVNQGLRQAYAMATRAGPVSIRDFPGEQVDLPELVDQTPDLVPDLPFADLSLPNGDSASLGLYPVVDSAQWLQRLLPLGVSTIQLRIKNLASEALEREIERAVRIARKANCRLFINDHWPLAIKYRAYGVHLGQGDLKTADMRAIHRAGLRLGISTHCHYEVARAHRYRPSYIACGPVYPTATKPMPWTPHGPEGFAYWRKMLSYPLVAIGGIKRAGIAEVSARGADGIAMITAITEAEDPEVTTRDFIHMINRPTAMT